MSNVHKLLTAIPNTSIIKYSHDTSRLYIYSLPSWSCWCERNVIPIEFTIGGKPKVKLVDDADNLGHFQVVKYSKYQVVQYIRTADITLYCVLLNLLESSILKILQVPQTFFFFQSCLKWAKTGFKAKIYFVENSKWPPCPAQWARPNLNHFTHTPGRCTIILWS